MHRSWKDEDIDVLDAKGHPTGQVLSRKEVHAKEWWHGGARVWVYNPKGQMLLQRRHPDVDIYPDTWDISAAGHLSAGDKPEQAAIREAEEELGLKISPDELEFIGITRAISPISNKGWTHKVFDWTYIVRRDLEIGEFKISSETTKFEWRDIGEVRADQLDPKRQKQYSKRPFFVYDMAITEIRDALKRNKTEG